MIAGDEIDERLLAGSLRGFVHATEIGTTQEVDLRADELVCLASVLKLPVLAALFNEGDLGHVDLGARIRVPADRRTFGPTGLSMFRDDVEMSVRDLAFEMVHVSDNTAADVVIEILGLETVNENLRRLGLTESVLIGDCKLILDQQLADTGLTADDFAAGRLPDPASLRHNRSLTPARTTRGTPREMTGLLAAIWTDAAASPSSCAEMRRILKAQVWPHRLRSAFGDGVVIAGKTGTLAGIRNEVGVAEFPDGRCYAVAIFTRSIRVFETVPAVLPTGVDPAADALVGTAARMAIDHLRSQLPAAVPN